MADFFLYHGHVCSKPPPPKDRQDVYPHTVKISPKITLSPPPTEVAVEFTRVTNVLRHSLSMMHLMQKSTESSLLENLMHDPHKLAARQNVLLPSPASLDVSSIQRNYALNAEQTSAVHNGHNRRVSLIQGPPGTGKTKTGVSLAHLWATNITKKKCATLSLVLYAGPSNQSVIVAVTLLRKF
eukprot:RCo018787